MYTMIYNECCKNIWCALNKIGLIVIWVGVELGLADDGDLLGSILGYSVG